MDTGEVNVGGNPEMNKSLIREEVDFMLLKLEMSSILMGHLRANADFILL